VLLFATIFRKRSTSIFIPGISEGVLIYLTISFLKAFFGICVLLQRLFPHPLHKSKMQLSLIIDESSIYDLFRFIKER
jgi:hypothetical protein